MHQHLTRIQVFRAVLLTNLMGLMELKGLTELKGLMELTGLMKLMELMKLTVWPHCTGNHESLPSNAEVVRRQTVCLGCVHDVGTSPL